MRESVIFHSQMSVLKMPPVPKLPVASVAPFVGFGTSAAFAVLPAARAGISQRCPWSASWGL